MRKIQIQRILQHWCRSERFYANASYGKNKHFSSTTKLKMQDPIYNRGKVQIYGNCEKEYESVKDAFVKNFISGQEVNSSICVYVKQKCVIDMYGTSIEDANYKPNSLQVNQFI